ncbi:inorganic diphosphatase [Rufibacter sediminis]|uniref:inorganic diphosphatase n=1 Tax=Rufibacter sediminis TaxID=2762756 RepID=A0ABR6VZ72_9BACT|nr:inorganic diphosphatase [Rufibacter sediminis]MBC3542063.1 inorganic diphosphatase [Rufibacter sediminis]
MGIYQKYWQFPLLLLAILCSSCQKDYRALPAVTETKHWQAVVETASGSTMPQVYDAQEKKFVPQLEAGQPRKLEFLPYPGNEGFIPSTLVDSVQGRPAAPLPVVILCGQKEPGTVLEILPIGVMILESEGELRHLIVAVPARPTEQTISPNSFSDFSARYPAVKSILEQWYLNVNPRQPTRLSAWKNEAFADKLIQQWVQ